MLCIKSHFSSLSAASFDGRNKPAVNDAPTGSGAASMTPTGGRQAEREPALTPWHGVGSSCQHIDDVCLMSDFFRAVLMPPQRVIFVPQTLSWPSSLSQPSSWFQPFSSWSQPLSSLFLCDQKRPICSWLLRISCCFSLFSHFFAILALGGL